jgi:hypothetical protein
MQAARDTSLAPILAVSMATMARFAGSVQALRDNPRASSGSAWRRLGIGMPV